MKITNLFKYIFIIFVIVILIYAGYKIYKKNNKIDNEIVEIETAAENIIKDIRLGICNYDTINPLISNNKEILNIGALIFEPLFTLNENYELEPCLAREWSKTGDETYVVKVDTTIKWQNGAYLTAKDVQFTIDKLKEGNSVYKANVAHIISVEVVDATTIKIILDKEVPFFEYNLTFPIMNNIYYYDEDFYASTKIPIGTGRFKISDISNNSITLVKNENWRNIEQDKSKIETIKINLYSSMGEVFNSFKLGNIDLLNTTNCNYQEYIGTIGFNFTEYAGREFDFISLNCNDAILQDKYVRQALNYAIDRSRIVSNVYNNEKIVSNYPLDYGNYLYVNESNSSGYNPDQAKKILQDNGWIYTSNRWIKTVDGSSQVLSINISVCKDNTNRVKVAEEIKAQLEEIGVSVRITQISSATYQQYLTNKDYQILITGVYSSYSPDITYFFGAGNIANYYNEDILAILQSGISTKSRSGLSEKYEQIFNIYKDEVPFIGLYRNKNIMITSQSLEGTVTPNNYNTFYNISSWYRK